MKNPNPKLQHDPFMEIIRLLYIIAQKLQQNETHSKLYYDNADMKQIFNISSSTLYRLRKQKLIPFKFIGNKIYYPVEQIDALLNDT